MKAHPPQNLADLAGKHTGETIYVVATGDTLDDFDFAELGNSPRILIHRAAMAPEAIPCLPGSTYWLVRDYAWRLGEPGPWTETLARCHAGEMVGVLLHPMGTDRCGDTLIGPGPNVVSWRQSKNVDSLDRYRELDELYMDASSGSTAAHLAVVLGAAKIVLIGFDGTGWAACLQHLYGSKTANDHRTDKYHSAFESLMETLKLLHTPYEIRRPNNGKTQEEAATQAPTTRH